MKPIVQQAHIILIKNKRTVAVAESCTGGLLSHLLTSIPGSSAFFVLGIVAYSNATKEALLSVPSRMLKEKGAVSAEVACALAENVRRLAKTDFGIGVSGIAGPGGGSFQKPVGTVYIAVSSSAGETCKRFLFKGTRNSIQKQAGLKALQLLKNACIHRP